MRLHRLQMTAFGPFGSTQTVDFDELAAAGLFLLHGPTGAGKTSVLDAVCYALYGKVPGARESGHSGAQGSALRSDHADPAVPTKVVLELTVAGRRLEITRQPAWLRPKLRGKGTTTEKAQSLLREHDAAAGAWKSTGSRSHHEIGEELTQLLGMSRDQFCQVVLLPQGDFARFLRADAEARGKLLGKLFATERFGEVEKRLAERRRATETRVKEADADLLARAHRMQQAAGDAMDLPALTPGDPGLAATVLAEAAVARSTAREQLDVARAALDAAEAHRAEAGRKAAEVRELARLQSRFADARARADRLEEGSAVCREAERVMERSRKAEAVAPALDLRRAAEAEHRAATAADRRARALLPAERAGDGAAGLAAAARRAAEELGGLESARRAEHRLHDLTAARDRLDRQERDDEEAIQEAEEWLAGWEETRAALQARAEAAQEAATRAEQLAAGQEPARRRLEAARERDRLVAETRTAHKRAAAARENAAAAHEHWNTLREQRLDGIAAELAAALREGEPCAVCGSPEHPAPAGMSAGHVDRAAEEAARADHRRLQEEADRAERHHAGLRESLAAAVAEAGEDSTEDLARELAELTERHRREHLAASDLHPAREELRRAEQEHARRTADRQEAAVRAAARVGHRERLDQERATLEQELAEARGAAASVAARAAQLERTVTLLDEAAEAARAAEDAAHRLKDADARLADAAYRAGFETPQAAADALLDAAEHRALQQRIDAWQQEYAAVRAVLAEEETAAADRLPPADPAAAETVLAAATRRAREAASAYDAAERRCADLDRLSAEAARAARALAPLRAEHDKVARMAGLAAGTSADNERRMRLESYVLAARLEQVAAAATARLLKMSGGRYTLVHSDDRSGRGRSGLGLHVVDAWTGRERDTATLSGGETFFASLALALGLADVVTDEAGGVRLDTLFIDEGFGSLDDQTLDEVLDVLDSLRERDRSVGIVSHVADLKRRVHAQLEVVKGRQGSQLRQRGVPGRG
ncbi:AAA family ATPase [Streptomyces fragilis]|uniref:Nuclease SbcCD subunit C n=1 Tax=Streptomyces fragilis TaxID=67301 RepID=A0ABV2YMN1_9ACTN|nr:SMC family ATPase [Streptomyces fragilis]